MRVLLRADASPEIGGGHVSRSLTLADAFARDGHCTEVVGAAVSQLASGRKLVAGGVRIREVALGEEILDPIALESGLPDLVVVDGYHFGHPDFEEIAVRGVPYAVIDDNGTSEAVAPVAVLNQNPHARADWYEHLLGPPLLVLGLSFALVRRDVLCRAPAARESGHVFVGFGASDVAGLARPIACSLADQGHEVLLTAGAIGDGAQEEDGRRRALPERVTLIAPQDYAEAMSNASVAVIGAGSTMWETAALGLPAIAVVVAENQWEASASAHGLGFVERVDPQAGMGPAEIADRAATLLADPERCDEMARLGRKVVDGTGADRAVAGIVHHVMATGVSHGR